MSPNAVAISQVTTVLKILILGTEAVHRTGYAATVIGKDMSVGRSTTSAEPADSDPSILALQLCTDHFVF